MKKVSLMIAALALVLGLSQCKKDEKPAASGEKQHIVLSANNGNDGSKVNVGVSGSVLNLTWEAGDKITVSGGASGELHLTGGAGTANATFEGDIELNRAGDIVFSVGSENCMGQTGTLDGLKERIYLVGTSEYKEDRNYDVTMELQYAVLKLDLSAFADDTKGAGVTVTITSGEEPLASVTGITSASKAVYVALPVVGTGSKKYTFNNGNGMNAEKTWTLAANIFYTANGPDGPTGNAIVMPAYPVGALPGLFTVNEAGDQVYFSKGNLYYDGESWGFEAEQHYFRTYSGKDKCDADGYSTSGTAEGHWGLFGWSTSNSYGMSISGQDSDYSGDFVDWGKNIGDGKTWRTLTGGTDGEWAYLLNSRTVNGGQKEGYSYQRATVNSVYGMILYPDNYTEQASYASTDWAKMESAGCVFLPAAGSRGETSVSGVGSYGTYWSSSYDDDDSDRAYDLYFYNSYVYPSYSYYRHSGSSVRLVSEN